MKKVLVFGTFDIIHAGHRHFLIEARTYGDQLVAVIARDKTAQEVKGRLPRHTELDRTRALKDSGLVDEVVLGGLGDKYSVIKEIAPDVIALGYDQQAFVDNLAARIGETITVVRLHAFEPDKYKTSLLFPRTN